MTFTIGTPSAGTVTVSTAAGPAARVHGHGNGHRYGHRRWSGTGTGAGDGAPDQCSGRRADPGPVAPPAPSSWRRRSPAASHVARAQGHGDVRRRRCDRTGRPAAGAGDVPAGSTARVRALAHAWPRSRPLTTAPLGVPSSRWARPTTAGTSRPPRPRPGRTATSSPWSSGPTSWPRPRIPGQARSHRRARRLRARATPARSCRSSAGPATPGTRTSTSGSGANSKRMVSVRLAAKGCVQVPVRGRGDTDHLGRSKTLKVARHLMLDGTVR